MSASTLRAVLDTEWRIASTGAEVFDLPYGKAARSCEWPGESLSHLAVIEDVPSFDPEHPMPCAHRYEVIAPAKEGFDLELPEEPRRDVAMHMKLPAETPGSEDLELEPVEDEAAWKRMSAMRVESEEAFGVEPERARLMVAHIRSRRRFLDGGWHLARSGERIVGGIGLVVFETASGRLGRLQDVDISPRFQGRGFGNNLMSAAIHEARRRGCSEGICLRADADDWPKEWYARRGFTVVGEWLRFAMPTGP